MGRRNKKFIDKKHSATFQLLARDSTHAGDAPSPASDRIFVRVDSNPYPLPPSLEEDPDSIFADAPNDTPVPPYSSPWLQPQSSSHPHSLPDHVRREILELGLPDDGYNYLLHLREIRHVGAGASYFHNDRARMDLVPLDVKAYDASGLRILDKEVEDDAGMMRAVAAMTAGVKLHRAMDPDVARLLEDGDSLRFGSDVEDLEEDFVARANCDVEGGDEIVERRSGVEEWLEEDVGSEDHDAMLEVEEVRGEHCEEKQRVRRLLDAQFDLLALREYDNDSDSDEADLMGKEGESLAAKLNDVLKDYPVDDLELEDKYRAPADYIKHDQGSATTTLDDSSVEVLRKCAEYAEMYCCEDKDKVEDMLFEESSDESEVWDCETIVTTYSNLDNHPGKITAPEKVRKKLPELIHGKGNVINLRGKEKIPVDFLPANRRTSSEKTKEVESEKPQKRPQDESREAKKERKAAVKEEKREARRAKKELKELYRSEAQKAQKVAAFTGPCSIHLM